MVYLRYLGEPRPLLPILPMFPKSSQIGTRLWRVDETGAELRPDQLAVEEPLEIRLIWKGERRNVAVTMRTPGADPELALGFLFAEGILASREHLRRVGPCLEPSEEGRAEGEAASSCANIVEVELDGGPEPSWKTLERHFFATSACGVCGKAGLESLSLRGIEPLTADDLRLAPEVLRTLPETLRQSQGLFAATGGLHAAGLFDPSGRLLALREDVGRHNALDKLLGWAFLEGRLPLHDVVVLVSGRSSYEILQKCLVARVPVVCAVSAPSSLAVELAERFGLTLVGFLRGDRFNVYAGHGRIDGLPGEQADGVANRRPVLPIAL
jgi:FdhD protein